MELSLELDLVMWAIQWNACNRDSRRWWYVTVCVGAGGGGVGGLLQCGFGIPLGK